MKQIFSKNGSFIILEKDIYEPHEHFIDRGNFIVSQQPKNNSEFTQALVYSRIFVNVKYNRAKYSDEVMEILEKKVLLTTNI